MLSLQDWFVAHGILLLLCFVLPSLQRLNLRPTDTFLGLRYCPANSWAQWRCHFQVIEYERLVLQRNGELRQLPNLDRPTRIELGRVSQVPTLLSFSRAEGFRVQPSCLPLERRALYQ